MKFLSLFTICLILGSCTDYYFSEPQPINSKNVFTVPKKHRGTWYINDSYKNDNTDSLIIGKNFYKRINKYRVKELKAELDLDSNTYYIGNKVYTNENGELEGGYNYKIEGDTVIIDVIEIELVEFGEKAFLRRIDYGYILNLNHEKMNNWWKIKFIDTRNKEGILIRELTDKDLIKDKNHKKLHDNFSKYIIAKWSIEHIQNFIDSGGFSDTTIFLKYNERFKN